jgi:hypothetical protein
VEVGAKFAEFCQGNNTGDTIVAVCIKEAEVQRKIGAKVLVVVRIQVNGMPIKPLFLTTIPTPASIRVRVAAVAFAAPNPFFAALTVFDAVVRRRYR